jgi:hypothetical protein
VRRPVSRDRAFVATDPYESGETAGIPPVKRRPKFTKT